MMGNTYAHVIEQSEKEWMKQVTFWYLELGTGIDDNFEFCFLKRVFSLSI